MRTISSAQASKSIQKFMFEAGEHHEPIQIIGKAGNTILLSEEDWRSIRETLYLLSIPGMRESVRKGLKTPLNKTTNKLEW